MPFQGILRTYLTPRSWPLLYSSDRRISLPPPALEQEERLNPVPGALFPSQALAGSSTSGQGCAEILHSGLPVPSLVPVVIPCTKSRAGTFPRTFLLLKTFHLAPDSHPMPTASALLSPATTSSSLISPAPKPVIPSCWIYPCPGLGQAGTLPRLFVGREVSSTGYNSRGN